MNFNLDDPLAGILSDGSDDSFFDDDVLGKKKPPKKNSTPTAAKKNALFDLDDTSKTKTTEDVVINKDKEGTQSSKSVIKSGDSKTVFKIVDDIKPTSPAPVRSIMSKESIKSQPDVKIKTTEKADFSRSPAKSKLTASVDKLDLLDELSVEPKKEPAKPLEKGKSSQSLLDDILGGPSTKTNVPSQKRPTTSGKKQDFDIDSILGKSESKQSVTSYKSSSQKSVPKSETPKETQIKKKTSDDWLGAFQEKDEIAEEDETDMPSWLVGSTSKKKTAPKASIVESKTEIVKQEPKPETTDVGDKEKDMQAKVNTDHVAQILTSSKVDEIATTKFELSNEDVSVEGAALYLQQQESQMMVALQLKAQDEKLAALQVRQKESQRVHREAAQAQREQLDALLRRQAEHRRQMQAVIAQHQERITQRIKSLLGPSNENHQSEDNPLDDFERPMEQTDSPYAKEKKQLLQLIQSLQDNHDKEIDLMETSYRRQLAFLEISFNQAEERMKEESDKLVKFYSEKINWLDEHHQLYKKLTEDNLNSIMERHRAEYEILRQQHLENAKVLQEHHMALMENVRNAVKQEQVLIKDSAGFSSELQELLIDVKNNKSQCNELVEKIEILTKNTEQHRERSVQIREAQISDMIEQLKRERESFEKEKSESKDLVHMLEARLKQMTTMIEEESVALKQKKMEFEFDKATFSKQTEFAKNVLKKQDEEIKMLKDDIQREYKEKIAKIDEEKAKAFNDSAIVGKEKAAVQSLKLDLEKTRAELQAQLDEVTAERSKLNLEKQELHIEEQRILTKSRDLDILSKSVIDKQAQAEKKYSEAELAQQKYEERIRRIQEHVVSLNAREKQIAKEKVALSRERLSLHNERKQLESRQQCSLCRNTQYSDQIYTVPESYQHPTVSRDYSAIPLNIVEREVAHLMGSSFKFHHNPEVNANYESRREDVEVESMLGTQADSGTLKDYLDPKFMMLRLDVQQVISNLDHSKKEEPEQNEDQH